MRVNIKQKKRIKVRKFDSVIGSLARLIVPNAGFRVQTSKPI